MHIRAMGKKALSHAGGSIDWSMQTIQHHVKWRRKSFRVNRPLMPTNCMGHQTCPFSGIPGAHAVWMAS